ncbi:hypothetical protein ABID08_005663 [Rhizobium binae]|uniref:Uncharacterized protein n=1 Tax=Rhizobium binae TaxID=1138190 RepID=A0ABV2MP91_9HYPH
MPLAIEADAVDGRAVADAGDDVLELSSPWIMKQNVVADNRFDLMSRRHVRKIVKPQAIIRATAQAQ